MVVCELLDSKKKPTGKLIVIFQKSKANSNCFNVIALPKDNEESWKSTGRSDTQTKCVPRMIQNVHKNRMLMLSVPIKMGEDMFNKDGYRQRLKARYVKFCQQQAAKQAEEETDAHSSGDELGASDEESEHLSEDIESSGSEFSGDDSDDRQDEESTFLFKKQDRREELAKLGIDDDASDADGVEKKTFGAYKRALNAV